MKAAFAALALFSLGFAWCPNAAAAPPDAWYPVESPTSKDLTAIAFAPDGTGFAVGDDGAVLRYDGTDWQEEPFPFGPLALGGVACPARGEAWILARKANRLYHIKDGRWNVVTLDRELDPMVFDFARPDLGYLGGLFGMLYRYDGKTWQRILTPALTHDRESHLRGVAVLGDHDVWVGGEQFLLHFDGTTWTRFPLPAGAANGYLQRHAGQPALLAPVSLRNGDSWERISSESMGYIARSTHDELWGIAYGKLGGYLKRLRPEGAEFSVSGRMMLGLAAAPDGLWAVGDRGLILHLEPRLLPSFVDRTFDAGAGVQALSERAMLVDLDRSGPRDLLLAKPFGRNSFLRAEEAGAFRSQPLVSPPLAQLQETTSLAAVDIDGDDWVDLVLRPRRDPHARPLQILRNLGGFRFWDIPSTMAPVTDQDTSDNGEIEVADLDGDLDLDIYDARTQTRVGSFPVPNVLHRNDGFGHFTSVTLGHYDGGAAWAWSNMVVAADLTGDGRIDLLSLNAWGDGNTFYTANQSGGFSDATAESGLEGDIHLSRGFAAGDVDGDGALDVLVLTTEEFGPSRLYRNDGKGHFHDVTSESGLDRLFISAAQAEFGDIDLDGDLDLVLGHALGRGSVTQSDGALRLLVNDGRGHFSNATVKAGLDQSASTFVVDDFDDDGDLDLYLVRAGESNRLLVNQPPYENYLKVHLESPAPNRHALGARVSVFGPDRTLLGFRETNWRKPFAHFGLGDLSEVTVEVRFPSGRIVRREFVPARTDLVLTELPRWSLWAHNGWFFLKHRWAWADKHREALALFVTIAFLIGLKRASHWAGARLVLSRHTVLFTLFGTFFALEIALAPLFPISMLARVSPPSTLFALGLVTLALDLRWTRRAQARFIGPYELLSELGQGGMGIVYKARDTSLPARPIVALKVLRPDRIQDPTSLRRFVREAEVGGKLTHPGIATTFASGECRVLDGGVWRSTAYLAMELVPGTSLADLLSGTDRPPLPRLLEIVRDAAFALSAAHSVGVLHRDVKPDNILLSRAGVVKLVDFGIAANLGAPSQTEVGFIVGTLGYLPPERAAGRAEDVRGDLYALGAVLYEAVCGRRPFRETDPAALLHAVIDELPAAPKSLRSDIPDSLNDLILALLEKDPRKRPPTGEAVAKALDDILCELRGERASITPIGSVNEPAQQTSETTPPNSETLDLPPPAPAKSVDDGFERITLDLPTPTAADHDPQSDLEMLSPPDSQAIAAGPGARSKR